MLTKQRRKELQEIADWQTKVDIDNNTRSIVRSIARYMDEYKRGEIDYEELFKRVDLVYNGVDDMTLRSMIFQYTGIGRDESEIPEELVPTPEDFERAKSF